MLTLHSSTLAHAGHCSEDHHQRRARQGMSWRFPISPTLTFRRLVGTRPATCATQPFRSYCACDESYARQACSPGRRIHANAGHAQHYTYRHHGTATLRTACFQQLKTGLRTSSVVADNVTSTASHTPSQEKQLTMDYTALVASVHELKTKWIPAKIEQVCISCVGGHMLAGQFPTLASLQHDALHSRKQLNSMSAMLAGCPERQAIAVPEAQDTGSINVATPLLASRLRPIMYRAISS